MALNDILKKEIREDVKSKKYRNTIKKVKTKKGIKQVEFIIISGGRIGREILRNIAKHEIKKNKGQLESPLGKMKSRQERKAMAKALKINFNPRYNGPVFKTENKLIEVKKEGKTPYMKLVSEVK